MSVLYAGDNRDFRANSVPTVVNDDWGVLYNRLHAQLEHGDVSFRLPRRQRLVLRVARSDDGRPRARRTRAPRGPTSLPDPLYFRAKVNEAGRELSNRYINWIYPAKYSAGFANRDIEVTLGDVYVELGQGLVLSLRKRDELASDDTLRGGRATGSLKAGDVTLGLTVLGGSANPLRIDEASGRYLGVHSSVTPGFLAVTEAGMPRAIETDFAPDTGDCATMLTCSYAPDRIAAGQFTFELGRTRLGNAGVAARATGRAVTRISCGARDKSSRPSQSVEMASREGAVAVYLEAAGQKLSDIESATTSRRVEIRSGACGLRERDRRRGTVGLPARGQALPALLSALRERQHRTRARIFADAPGTRRRPARRPTSTPSSRGSTPA